MSTVSGVGAASIFVDSSTSTDPMSVAAALSRLKLKPGSTVAISDTLANLQKNLDALQAQAARITGLSTTDASQQLTVSAAQYQKDGAILAKWGAGDGNSVEVTGLAAANAAAFVAAKPSYVNTITVSDSAANVQKNLDGLQSLVSGGSLRQISFTGASSTMRISAAQLSANQDALGAIKNRAYALVITEASVSDTLGLDGQQALTANSRVKSIEVKDGTDAIEANLDGLQRVGLRLKSIAQTDPGATMTITAAQYSKDSIAVGKILTSYHLDVIRASAAQAAKLASNQKVSSVSVADSAANIARKWSLIQRLSDSLTAVEVTDPANAITLSSDQLALSEGVLAKFTDDADHTYKLNITGVRAELADSVAAVKNVSAVNVSDTADNIAANLDDLQSVDGLGVLKAVTVTGKSINLQLDASRLQGAQAAGTQGVLDKITNRHYGLAVTGAGMGAVSDLAANARVVSVEVAGSSSEIRANLDSLYGLGRRLSRIEQSDAGVAIDVTQAQFDTRASVLGKVAGGYTVNVSGASATKAFAAALNSHVARVSVADTGRNLVAHWSALRSIGTSLDGVTKTDAGNLSLSATSYLTAQGDGLLGKFDAATRFTVTGASVAQATQVGADDVVAAVDVTDDGSVVAQRLGDLGSLLGGGKLHGITLNAGATRLSLHASQLDAAQDVLDLIQGGRYSLAVDQVDVADAKDLLAGNSKIASLQASGDAAGIADHLADLASMGRKLQTIVRTDSATSALALTGAQYEQHKTTLDKIVGGYQAELSGVAATKAAGLAGGVQVKSVQVADTGANLASAWDALGTLGAKLGGISQTDSALVRLTAAQWSASQALSDKFSGPLALSISGVGAADVATLEADGDVQQIQVADSADALSDAWSDLAAGSKVTQIRVTDPGTALAMSAQTFAASSTLLGLMQDAQYSVALSEVAAADAATLAANAHVSALDVAGSSAEVAAQFDSLAALDKLGTISLGDDGPLTLGAAQLLGGADTLAKIDGSYQIAATGVALADLSDVQAVDGVASIGISDSAANVSDNLANLAALGSTLSGVQLDDASPVLALTQQDWAANAGVLGKIGGAYQVDLSEVDASATATLAADTTVRQLSVADTAERIATEWSALVAAYNAGAGKLVGLSLNDDQPLTLSAAQQTDGAALIAALLPNESIVTAG